MKILLVDDHVVVREGIKQIIKSLHGITLIDEAVNGNEALLKIKKTIYDIIILDISMPGMSGIDILQYLNNNNTKARVLMLSVHPEAQYAIRAFKLGACGYISKNSAYEELVFAIKKVVSGDKYISKSFSEEIAFNKIDTTTLNLHEKLSEREFQVMLMIAKGKSVTEIADEIFISVKTVSTYRTRILEKMSLKNNAQLTLYAIKNNLIE